MYSDTLLYSRHSTSTLESMKSSKMQNDKKWSRDAQCFPTMYQDQSCAQESLLEAGVHKRSRRSCKIVHLRSRTIRVLLAALVMATATGGVLYLVGACISGISLRPWLRERYSSFPDWEVPSLHPDPHASARYPTTITRNVKPLQCHSHNDYWRHVPLYEALHFGCTSVEADIWLMDDMEGEGHVDFYIGHSLASLERKRTLRNLYINPLVRILDAKNYNATPDARSEGVFETEPTQGLVLLVDIKNEPTAAFAALSAQLEPLRAREYLTYHDGTNLIPGPLTIVATGSTPYTSILAQNATHRDIFFDAPLGDLATSVPNTAHPADIEKSIDDSIEYNTSTSLYASQSLRKVLGHPIPFLLPGSPSHWQLERIRLATEAAHARGLKVRWWDTPDWPRSRRNRVWKILMEEGADVLNVDDLRAARDWDGW